MSSSKRKNPDENGDDDENLLGLLEGDHFVTEEENRQRQAEKRRLERKRRLQRLSGPDDDDKSKPSQSMPMEVEKSSPANIKQESPPDSSNPVNRVPVEKSEPKKVKEEHNSEDEDEFDMFSSSVSPVDPSATNTKIAKNIAANGGEGTQQDWDDSEGYYKTVIGEIISIDTTKHENNSHSQSASADTDTEGIRLRVLGHIGKGVFSSVLKCSVTHNITSTPMPPVVAVKCIRHNETMAKVRRQVNVVFDRLPFLRVHGNN